MPASRQTFGKFQRERDKRDRARAKQAQRAEQREARAARAAQAEPPPAEDQTVLLEAFEKLHKDYAAGRVPEEEFETRVADLREKLSAF